jgi:lipoprotein-anchoring transpeptidase ErfK/SrfK
MLLRTIAVKLGTGLLFAGAMAAGGMGSLNGATPTPAAPPAALVAAPLALSAQAQAPVHAASHEEFVVRRILDIPGPLKMGDHHWNEEGAPAQGAMVITVDLEAQTLSVFRGGYEIGAAAILYGADDKPTPLGVFPITQKKAHHISNLYGVPMPYMLRLTNDGISVHGSDVKPGTATHGCIGVPTPFAKKLFGAVSLGDVVIITRGKRLQMGEAIVRS